MIWWPCPIYTLFIPFLFDEKLIIWFLIDWRELKYFYVFFEIWSNQMMNWGDKLRILIYLERELKDESKEKKITQFDRYALKVW